MTNLSIRSESFGGSDDRWLGSREGLATARTVTLDSTAFPGAVDGVVKSGTQVAEGAGGKVAQFTDDTTQTFLGYLADDRSISNGDAVAPLLDRGRIRTAFLPLAHVASTDAAASRFALDS